MQFTPSCLLLASGYSDGFLRVWNLKDQSIEWSFQNRYTELDALAWDKAGRSLAYSTSSGDVTIFDYKQKTVVHQIGEKNYRGVSNLIFGKENTILVSSNQGNISNYSLDNSKVPLNNWILGQSKLTFMKESPNDSFLIISGGIDQKVYIVDKRVKEPVLTQKVGVPITAGSMLKDSKSLVVGGYYGELFSLDLRKSKPIDLQYKGVSKEIIRCIDTNANQVVAERKQISATMTSKHIKDIPEQEVYHKVEKNILDNESFKEPSNSLKGKDIKELKEELKSFIRLEVDSLKVEMIKQLEHQKEEIKNYIKKISEK